MCLPLIHPVAALKKGISLPPSFLRKSTNFIGLFDYTKKKEIEFSHHPSQGVRKVGLARGFDLEGAEPYKIKRPFLLLDWPGLYAGAGNKEKDYLPQSIGLLSFVPFGQPAFRPVLPLVRI